MFRSWFRSATAPQKPVRPIRDIQLNVYNIDALRRQPPNYFDALRFDPNNDCNVHCVYCHNHRSRDAVDSDAFRAFLHENVTEVDTFQMGCIMEPTLDSRMCELLLVVAASPARPKSACLVQTNGILLHLHDPLKMRDAGLTRLSISIDSADPAIHKALRGGTSLSKVFRNIEAFTRVCSQIEIHFITTVTRMNVGAMDSLVSAGLDLGVRHFVMREVFYRPESDVVDHTRMPDLLLRPGEFTRMSTELAARFGAGATFEFAERTGLEQSEEKMRIDSLRRQ